MKTASDAIGEIKINPSPIICIVVLYFPSESDLTSTLFPNLETINTLK